MVFVPRPHLSTALLGLAPGYPRAVPNELLVALASRVIGGQVTEKVILVAIVAGAAFGASRLLRASPPAARVGAGLLYAWNPLVYERLLLGQWALLLGYAALPWAVSAALSFRRGGPRAEWLLALGLVAVAAAGPYTGVIGGATVLAVALWPPHHGVRPHGQSMRRPRWRVRFALVAAVVANLPWLVPALLIRGVHVPSRSLDLFAARSDSPLGTVGSLISLGGLWRTDLAPPGRMTWAWVPAFILIAALAVVGWRRLPGGWTSGARRGLLAAALIGFGLALAPQVPGLREAERWMMGVVPAAGLLRDSQKFVLPLALAEAVAFGAGIAIVVERLGRGLGAVGGRILAVAMALLPVALAPTLVWAAGNRLHTSRYPTTWDAVQRITSLDPVPGGILILPWHAYVPLPWNGPTPVHQPATLFFSRPVVTASALELGAATLPGEDPWAAEATPAAMGSGPLGPSLSPLGVRYVLIEKIGDWRSLAARTTDLSRVVDGSDLALYRAPRPGPVPAFRRPPAGPVVAGDVCALLLVLVSGAAVAGAGLRRTPMRRGPASSPRRAVNDPRP